jgi:hypothetical protein
MTEDRRKRAKIRRITRKVKIKNRIREEITKVIIKVIRVVHNSRQYKALLISNCSTLALLKTTFTLTV